MSTEQEIIAKIYAACKLLCLFKLPQHPGGVTLCVSDPFTNKVTTAKSAYVLFADGKLIHRGWNTDYRGEDYGFVEYELIDEQKMYILRRELEQLTFALMNKLSDEEQHREAVEKRQRLSLQATLLINEASK